MSLDIVTFQISVKDFSNRPFTAELSSQKNNAGQYDASNDGSDYKVIYRKSDYNNWTYLSIIKISELNKQSRSIGWFTFIIGSIMFLGILIFALFGIS